MWGILLAVALGVLVYNTTIQVLNYLSFNHTTKYDIEFVHDLGKSFRYSALQKLEIFYNTPVID